jgi:hypothetical protein
LIKLSYNPTLYKIGQNRAEYPAAFHDIEKGNNTFACTDVNGNTVTIAGYNAGGGWDAASGWGSPIVSHLIWYLW